jgi:hypothetical protein
MTRFGASAFALALATTGCGGGSIEDIKQSPYNLVRDVGQPVAPFAACLKSQFDEFRYGLVEGRVPPAVARIPDGIEIFVHDRFVFFYYVTVHPAASGSTVSAYVWRGLNRRPSAAEMLQQINTAITSCAAGPLRGT